MGALIAAGSTTEATYYPAVKSLIASALAVEDLPFDLGTDLPLNYEFTGDSFLTLQLELLPTIVEDLA